MSIKTKYFELTILTRREWTRRMIREQGRLSAIRSYMDRYKACSGDALAYVRETSERMKTYHGKDS